MRYDRSRLAALLGLLIAAQCCSAQGDNAPPAKDYARLHYSTSMQLVQEYWDKAQIGLMQEVLSHFETPDSQGRDLRGFEWYFWKARLQEDLLTLKFDKGGVECIDVHPDGVKLAAGSSDGEVRIWNTNTGEVISKIKSHAFGVPAVRYSHDGSLLYVCAHDSQVEVFDAQNGKKVQSLGRRSGGFSLALSNDGKRLATGGSTLGRSHVWDLANNRSLFLFTAQSECVIDLAYHPTADIIATGSRNKIAHLWNGTTGEHLKAFHGHSDMINGVAFSPTGSRLATASDDLTVRVWNCTTGESEVVSSGHTDEVNCVTFDPDGTRYASGSKDRTVRLWDARTGRLLRTYKGHSKPVTCVRFDRTGSRLISASHDGSIRFWDVSPHEFTPLNIAHDLHKSGSMTDIAISPDLRTAASTDWGNSLRIWDIKTGVVIFETVEKQLSPHCIRYSPDSKLIAVACNDRIIRIVDAATGKVKATLSGHTDTVSGLAFTKDGRTLVSSSSDKTIVQWDVNTGEEIRTIPTTAPSEPRVSVSADGKLIAGNNDYDVVCIWDAKSKKKLHTLKLDDHSSATIKFSPDATRLAVVKWRKVALFDVASGKLIVNYHRHGDNIYHLVFSPDGKRIATGDADHVVKVWDATTGDDLLTLRNNRSYITGMSFSDDGMILAAADAEGALCIWDVHPDAQSQLLRSARRLVSSQTAGPRSKDETLNSLKSSPVFAETLKSQALELCSGIRDKWETLAEGSKARSWQHDASKETRSRSLALAQLACRLSQDADDALTALSAAQYRIGQFKEASLVIARRKTRSQQPEDLWMEAMIHHSAGSTGAARAIWFFARETLASSDPSATQALEIIRARVESALFGGDLSKASQIKGEVIAQVNALAAMLNEPASKSDVRRQLEDRKELTVEQRQLAQAALEFLEEPEESAFNDAAWKIASSPRESPKSYAKAVRLAQQAVEKRQEDGSLLNTLGVALYRAGKFPEAVETLKKADQINARFIGPQVADLAFLVMGYHRLGKQDEAETVMNRLIEAMKGKVSSEDRQFFEEVQSLVKSKLKK